MKHLLNNLSEEEKNNIRKLHEGGMKLSIENFKRLVETKSGDVKPYLNDDSEQEINERPEEGSDMVGLDSNYNPVVPKNRYNGKPKEMNERPEEGSDMVGLDSNYNPVVPKNTDDVDKKNSINESLDVNVHRLKSTYLQYNRKGSDKTFDEIFGELRKEKPYSDFRNGCATKVSLALQNAGKKIKPGFIVQDGPMKGTTIQTSAAGLVRELGEPDINIQDNTIIGKEEFANKIGKNKTGVLICSPCGFGPGISGHATIYSNGKTLDNTNYHLSPGVTVKFWEAKTPI